jgi:hypothetical protein
MAKAKGKQARAPKAKAFTSPNGKGGKLRNKVGDFGGKTVAEDRAGLKKLNQITRQAAGVKDGDTKGGKGKK